MNLGTEPIGRLPTSRIGQAGEHLVCYLFHMWNYNLHQTLDPTCVYDFAVERSGVWKTLQVKHTTTKWARIKKHDDAKNYVEGDFDYLCACTFPYVYIVPFKKLECKTSFAFSKYPEYKWDLNDPDTYNIRPDIVQ